MPDLKDYLSVCSPKCRKFVAAAQELGAEITPLSLEPPILELRHAGKRQVLYKSHLPFNTKNASLLAGNKSAAKALFRAAGLSTPSGIIAKNPDEAVQLAATHDLRFPLAAKPLDGTAGLGVFLFITDEPALRDAATKIMGLAQKSRVLKSELFLVEEMASGKDYRLLVLDGEVIACAERQPASVTGDGHATIEDLVARTNENRPESFRLRLDEESDTLLEKEGLVRTSVLSAGTKVILHQSANVSLGGTPIDRTEEMSPRFRAIAAAAAAALGLRYAGIDIMTEDISSDAEAPYWILEANGNLIDFDIHEPPLVVGPGRNIAADLIARLFE